MSLGAAFWQRKFWILVPTIVAFLASLAIVNRLPTRYSGEARVLLENRETVYSRPTADTRQDPTIDPEAVASQVQIVMSKDLALKVIRDMELTKHAEFAPNANDLSLVKIVGMLIGLMNDPRSIPLEERVLQTYYKSLLVFPQGKSRVISIEFQSEDPQLAAAVANKIAEEYLSREELAKRDTSKVTSEWLDKAIEPLMKRVMTADAKVEAFRTSKGLFVGSNNMSISSQQLAEMNSQLATARTQRADLSARARLIREAVRLGRVFETSEINNNELVRRLLEQRSALKAQIAFDERTLLSGHPRMQEMNSQLRDLEAQVRAAAERAARALENDARAAGARLESLQAELNNQKKTAALSNEDEVQLKALEREALALREQLVSYRNKFLDAAARSNETASPADGRIISRAFAQNDPASPKRLLIVALATIGTLVISSALVASLHLMARVSSFAMADFAGAPGYPAPDMLLSGPAPFQPPTGGGSGGGRRPGLLGSTMERFRKPEPVVAPGWNMPRGPMPAQARAASGWFADPALPNPNAEPGLARAGSSLPDQIAAELALLGVPGRAKVLVLQGLGRDRSVALQAMRIGRRLAQDGATVIVDLCGANPLYSRVVGDEVTGLADYLIGTVDIPDVLHRDPHSRLHLVPAGEPLASHLSGTSARLAVQLLLRALAQAYAVVMIDAGAVGGAADFVAETADRLCLVAPEGTDKRYLQEAITKLEEIAGAPVLVIDDQPGRSLDAAA
jgi:succinoglycan biosynthesis transport protein ExoP